MVKGGTPVLRGEVYWINLDPATETGIRKTRLALVVSPDDMNAALSRVIVATITSKGQPLVWRPDLPFEPTSPSGWIPLRITFLEPCPLRKNYIAEASI